MDKLGAGTFGVVYKEVQGTTVTAVKKFNKLIGRDIPHPVLRELTMIQLLSHPHLVRHIATRRLGQEIELVMEYGGINLRKYCRETPQTVRYRQVVSVAYQLLSVLNYFYSVRAVHRDIKPDNILITIRDDKPVIKVCDLGLAKILTPCTESENSPRVCTLNYRPPEHFASGAAVYTHAVDMWGLGCVLIEFVRGEPLFTGRSEPEVLRKILQTVPVSEADHKTFGFYIKYDICNKEKFFKLPDIYDFTLTNRDNLTDVLNILQQLVEAMLHVNPSTRITAKQAIQHRLFAGYDKPPEVKNLLKISARHAAEPHHLHLKVRNSYVNYIFEFTEAQKLQKQTTLLAADMFDRAVCILKPDGKELALLTASIIWMCSKYVDLQTVNRQLFTKKFTEEDLQRTERKVFECLGFICHRATLLDLYRELRGPKKIITDQEWQLLKNMMMDYDRFRGKGTEEVTTMLKDELGKISDEINCSSSAEFGSRLDRVETKKSP